MLYTFGQYDALQTREIEANEEDCLKADYEKANTYLKLALEQGDKKSFTPLGWLAAFQKNYKLAQEIFEKGSQAGDASSDYWHAMLYVDGKIKTEDAKEKIIALLTKSAEAGYPAAYYELALIYLADDALKEQGLDYLKQAAKLDYKKAQEHLAKYPYNELSR